MRRKSIVAMTVAMSMFVLTFSGCSNSKGNKNSGKSAESETKTVSDTKTVSANISEEEQQVYDDLFNIENSVTVKIDISQRSWINYRMIMKSMRAFTPNHQFTERQISYHHCRRPVYEMGELESD